MGSCWQVVLVTTVPQNTPVRNMILPCLLSLLLLPLHSPHPFPQVSDLDDAYPDEYYGDYDAEAPSPPSDAGIVDLLRTGTSVAQDLLGLLGEKVKFVNTLLADQDLRDRVESTVSTGVNLTGQIARVGVPLVTSVVQQGPALLNTSRSVLQTINTEDNQQRIRQVARAGTRVAQGVGTVAARTPQLIGQGSRLAGSLIKAANDTAPLIIKGIDEFTEQLPLIASFASAYAEVNAEQTQKVAQRFHSSLQCDLQCGDKMDRINREQCVKQFCSTEQE